jgi:PST family polysaccharide transporter/lipopolysaccharide exporter
LIRILCFYGLFRALGRLAGTFFTSVGKPSISVRIIILRVVVLALLILPLGSSWGAAGVAVSLTVSMAVSVIWSQHLVNIELKTPAIQVLLELLPQALAALLMGLGLSYLARLLPVSLPALALMVLSGAGLYGFLALLLGRGRTLQDFLEIVRLLLHRPESPATGTAPVSPAARTASEEKRL